MTSFLQCQCFQANNGCWRHHCFQLAQARACHKEPLNTQHCSIGSDLGVMTCSGLWQASHSMDGSAPQSSWRSDVLCPRQIPHLLTLLLRSCHEEGLLCAMSGNSQAVMELPRFSFFSSLLPMSGMQKVIHCQCVFLMVSFVLEFGCPCSWPTYQPVELPRLDSSPIKGIPYNCHPAHGHILTQQPCILPHPSAVLLPHLLSHDYAISGVRQLPGCWPARAHTIVLHSAILLR